MADEETDFTPPSPGELRVDEDHLDENGYASIWNIAIDTVGGENLENVRDVAARILGFMCKQGCDFAVITSNDAEYLDGKWEQDKKVLYDWKKESEMVDLVTQHIDVPIEALKLFLANRRYKPDANYAPVRKDRVAWFQETLNIG